MRLSDRLILQHSGTYRQSFVEPKTQRGIIVINNPLKYIDPSGHGFFSDLWEDIKDFGEDLWEDVKDVAEDVWDWIEEHVNINVHISTEVAAFGNGGNGPGDVRFEYAGPGSGRSTENVISSSGGSSTYDRLDPRFHRLIGNELYNNLYGDVIDYDYYINNPDYMFAGEGVTKGKKLSGSPGDLLLQVEDYFNWRQDINLDNKIHRALDIEACNLRHGETKHVGALVDYGEIPPKFVGLTGLPVIRDPKSNIQIYNTYTVFGRRGAPIIPTWGDPCAIYRYRRQ